MLLLSACTGPAPDETPPDGFGAGFLWGAAMAGFQVDPGCPTIPAEDCEDRASDWYQWVTDPELIADPSTFLSGQPLSDGPGHYELYALDLQLAQDLGLNALRVSLEWSRLFPDAEAEEALDVEDLDAYVDPEAVAFYHDYLGSMRAVGMTPLVTLNHYTLPLWLHDGKACHQDLEGCTNRGWLDRERMLRNVSLYAGWCAREFGSQVDLWATLNEPLAIVLAGYLLPSEDRTNPPGVMDADAAFEVFFNLVEGHGAMYDAIQAYDAADAEIGGEGDDVYALVGLVPNLAAIAPTDPSNPDDVRGVEDANYVYNELFLNAAIEGAFDRDLDGKAEEHHDELVGRMDYIGVNYYTRITVRGLSVPLFGDYAKTAFFPDVLWEEYPEGLGEVLTLADGYGYPTIVTENGTTPTDESGETFLRPHLQAAEGALRAGVDLRGYFYWSLLDNYEWNHGMDLKFGLYAVDEATKARTLRPIGETYRSIIEAGGP